MFANTERGQAQRLAYYEARKLDRLPDSLLNGTTSARAVSRSPRSAHEVAKHSGHQYFLGLPGCPVAGLGAT